MTALNERRQVLEDLLPFKVNQKVFDMVYNGGVYLGGRDKQFRPLLIFNPSVLVSFSPESEELMAAIFLVFSYMFNNMLLDGHVENFTQV